MARPRTPDERRLTRIVRFRLTEADHIRLAREAETVDMSVGELARALTLSRVERLVIEATASHDPALVRQLYHIGHNLNQLTKNAHIFGRIQPRVEALCRRIDALMDEAIGKEAD
ncbi:mobilization protein [Haloferula helveola]|uniref:Mobilization protein n=1 Tax=Haloferula helveola TaxID=490095 RepID=A0ABN6H7K8_9BACT|nr:mobilization protein [Haloferula helveola]